MPNVTCTITQEDVSRSKYIREMERVYRDSLKVWDKYYKQKNFDTGATMVFKRYPNLLTDEQIAFEHLDILVKCLLGNEENISCRFPPGNAILNDAWVVNVKQQTGDVSMSTLGGFGGIGGIGDNLRSLWGEKMETHKKGVDVSDELVELMKVYTDAHKHLEQKHDDSLRGLIHVMRNFIAVYDQKKEISDKIDKLKSKVGYEEEDEDGDDE